MSSSSNGASGKKKVLIVDDSPSIRKLLREVLSANPGLNVVGEAEDPLDAREKIKALNPDVLTLDVEMPKMDGISFLKNLMRLRPMPVVMVSTLTETGAQVTLEALEIGAVDYVTKPKSGSAEQLRGYSDELVAKVLAAANAASHYRRRGESGPRTTLRPGPEWRPRKFDIIAVGASTGGVEAIHKVVSQLDGDLPPIVVAQHILKSFSLSFTARLDRLTPLTVMEPPNGEVLQRRHIYVAPGDEHMVVKADSDCLRVRRLARPKINGHRPSVDALFESVASAVGRRSLGVLLTGMGKDGASGLLKMHEEKAVTVAQDEKSSVVWGMPRAAIEMGAADHVMSLGQVGSALRSLRL